MWQNVAGCLTFSEDELKQATTNSLSGNRQASPLHRVLRVPRGLNPMAGDASAMEVTRRALGAHDPKKHIRHKWTINHFVLRAYGTCGPYGNRGHRGDIDFEPANARKS